MNCFTTPRPFAFVHGSNRRLVLPNDCWPARMPALSVIFAFCCGDYLWFQPRWFLCVDELFQRSAAIRVHVHGSNRRLVLPNDYWPARMPALPVIFVFCCGDQLWFLRKNLT